MLLADFTTKTEWYFNVTQFQSVTISKEILASLVIRCSYMHAERKFANCPILIDLRGSRKWKGSKKRVAAHRCFPFSYGFPGCVNFSNSGSYLEIRTLNVRKSPKLMLVCGDENRRIENSKKLTRSTSADSLYRTRHCRPEESISKTPLPPKLPSPPPPSSFRQPRKWN